MKRSYGQYCGFSRALEIVGERWALLVVRDLLVGPKRFTDLLNGLPGIPTNVLAARLKELESEGIVRRRLLPPPDRSVVYELTEYGLELDEPVRALGRWGAKALGDPRPGETVTVDSFVSALRTTFQPKAARGRHLSYELRLGEIVAHARVDDGKLEAGRGPAAAPDLIVEAGPAIKAVLARELAPQEAVAAGLVRLTGDERAFAPFVEMFRIEELPKSLA